MNRRKLLTGVLAGIVATTAVAAYALWPKNALDDVPFVTLKGEHLKLRDLRGKVVLVNFWATNCPVCMKEMPELVEVYRKYHDRGFEIIAVAMSYDVPALVKTYAVKLELPFPVSIDADGHIARAFDNTSVVPTSFLIDKEGKLVSRSVGMISMTKFNVLLDASL